MRKVFFYGAISLDGFLATKNDSLQWLFDTDLGGNSSYKEFEKRIDTVVMGNTTYKETQKLMNKTSLFPGKEKIIFSRKNTGRVQEGYYVSREPVSLVKELKSNSGKAIWIAGGGRLFTQLFIADVIDELWIQIAPVILGKGKRLFEEGDFQKRLKLVAEKRMGEFTELHLKRVRIELNKNSD
ncbi:dihydrofolate reductase family protein [Liquorilactobacillus oeni]|uniref:Dihydrofolate reductase n=1 Tax=Liquorilactobacillus oeni DSM 19972 TaxID=1423777 RepID=A0A0R1MBD8_9LACO|nr:dihydrofolate reductase family protein [Liquorilactobacillus oeni]KRL05177.1 dihydrofolate reductase [Liquorilactobacillus oeni DSM 19972]